MKINGVDYGDTTQPIGYNQLITLLSLLYLAATPAKARPVSTRASSDLVYIPKKDPNMPTPDYYGDVPSFDWLSNHHPISVNNTDLGIVVAGDHTASYFYDSQSASYIANCFNYDKFQAIIAKTMSADSSSSLVDYDTECYTYDYGIVYETQFNSVIYGLTNEDCVKYKEMYADQIDSCSSEFETKLAAGIAFIAIGLAAGLVLLAAVAGGIYYCRQQSSQAGSATPLLRRGNRNPSSTTHTEPTSINSRYNSFI